SNSTVQPFRPCVPPGTVTVPMKPDPQLLPTAYETLAMTGPLLNPCDDMSWCVTLRGISEAPLDEHGRKNGEAARLSPSGKCPLLWPTIFRRNSLAAAASDLVRQFNRSLRRHYPLPVAQPARLLAGADRRLDGLRDHRPDRQPVARIRL